MHLRIFFMELASKIIHSIRWWLYRLKGYKNIQRGVILERNLLLDRVNPRGIYIGEKSLIANGVVILSHEHIKRDINNPKIPLMLNTYIGERCFIGINSIILPGVRIGNDCVVGAGSVVTKDIPSGCIVVGNPARIIKTNIKMNDKAILEGN